MTDRSRYDRFADWTSQLGLLATFVLATLIVAALLGVMLALNAIVTAIIA